jgi:hypothetical protein
MVTIPSQGALTTDRSGSSASSRHLHSPGLFDLPTKAETDRHSRVIVMLSLVSEVHHFVHLINSMHSNHFGFCFSFSPATSYYSWPRHAKAIRERSTGEKAKGRKMKGLKADAARFFAPWHPSSHPQIHSPLFPPQPVSVVLPTDWVACFESTKERKEEEVYESRRKKNYRDWTKSVFRSLQDCRK